MKKRFEYDQVEAVGNRVGEGIALREGYAIGLQFMSKMKLADVAHHGQIENGGAQRWLPLANLKCEFAAVATDVEHALMLAEVETRRAHRRFVARQGGGEAHPLPRPLSVFL